MSGKKSKKRRDVRQGIRKQIQFHVAAAFPGCVAEFSGQQSAAALQSRTFGFRVRDSAGRYRSNIVWVDPTYAGEINLAWVVDAVQRSNG